MKSALFLFFMLLLTGLALLCCGVYVLTNLGWALIAAAVSLLFLAFLASAAIRRLFSKGVDQ